MRVFFGLELDQTTMLQIAAWRDRELHCAGRPVPPANFHITLAFVGDIQPATLERLCLQVERAASNSNITNTELLLDRAGYWQKPGIFWVGCNHTPPLLGNFAKKVRSLASGVGSRLDKKSFQPHVTLYRRCTVPPQAPPSIPAFTVPCARLTLFESVQGREGVRYTALEDWKLS